MNSYGQSGQIDVPILQKGPNNIDHRVCTELLLTSLSAQLGGRWDHNGIYLRTIPNDVQVRFRAGELKWLARVDINGAS